MQFLGGMDADIDEFFSISACDGRILSSQSTFGWWASELNQSPSKLDICMEKDAGTHIRAGKVFLNHDAIRVLCASYRMELASATKGLSSAIRTKVIDYLSAERNDEAIHLIDLASIDSQIISEQDSKELTSMKAVALAQ